jgi:hypothetical protein
MTVPGGGQAPVLLEVRRAGGGALGAPAAAALADKLHAAVDANTNAVAVIRKHGAGNLASRRTDFRTTAGEKPDGPPHDFPRDVFTDGASRAGS